MESNVQDLTWLRNASFEYSEMQQLHSFLVVGFYLFLYPGWCPIPVLPQRQRSLSQQPNRILSSADHPQLSTSRGTENSTDHAGGTDFSPPTKPLDEARFRDREESYEAGASGSYSHEDHSQIPDILVHKEQG
uniref:Uncharacterized protein n=1 Tax=Molossus molossus TaxID=27622 RepID=A0A7J8FTS3_MOLMO|nr:hypothetical protein HJG59_008410 [Molossus molossus]